MDFVKIALGGRKCFTVVPPAEIGELAERRARFAPLDDLRVFGNVSEVLVVAEPTVAEEMVDLIRREVLEGVGPVQGIAAADIRRGCGGVTAECEEGGVVDARRLELGLRIGVRRRRQ